MTNGNLYRRSKSPSMFGVVCNPVNWTKSVTKSTEVDCNTITMNSVHGLYRRFYGLKYKQQTLFLIHFINIHEPKSRGSKKPEETPRKLAGYNINDKPCLKTSSITIKHIRVLHKKMKCGEVAQTDRNS